MGQVIGNRYRVEEELGRGGMARVFRVHDLELEEDIALKILTRGTPENQEAAAEQFKQEIRLARRILHPNVCRIFDFGRWQDILFITMELVWGENLEKMLKRGKLSKIEDRLGVFRDVLAGLRAAHAQGIIHLDIKPANIMVTRCGRTVVMDFGLAGEMGRSGPFDGGFSGTPRYSAPERFLGKPPDNRSDIYSLGILLFELTTNRAPFEGNLLQLSRMHLNDSPPRPSDLVPGLPESVDRAIACMLAKNPADRYGSVDLVLEELADIRLHEPGRSVLLAVGDEHLCALLERHLTGVGLAVRGTSDGEQAIELLLREKPDLVLVDTEVAKIDGFRIVEMLRRYRHAAEVPVFATSTIHHAGYVSFARQLGILRLVPRPFASRALARMIRHYLATGKIDEETGEELHPIRLEAPRQHPGRTTGQAPAAGETTEAGHRRDGAAAPSYTPTEEQEREAIMELVSSINSMDHYQVLGIPPTADTETVQSTWAKVQQAYQPRRANLRHLRDLGQELEAIYRKAEHAHEVLSSPILRRRYDRIRQSVTNQQAADEAEQARREEQQTQARRQLVAANLSRAEDLVARGDVQTASDLLHSAGKLQPEPEVFLRIGRIMSSSSKLSRQAIDYFTKAVDLDMRCADAWVEMARIYQRRGLGERERRALEKALAADPANADAAEQYRKSFGAGQLKDYLRELEYS